MRAGALLVAVSCGASDPRVARPHTEHTVDAGVDVPVEAAAPSEPVVDAGVDAPLLDAEAPAAEPIARSGGPADHHHVACPGTTRWSAPMPSDGSVSLGGFRAAMRLSRTTSRRRGEPTVTMRPGTSLAIEFALENAGTEPIALSAEAIQSLSYMAVVADFASFGVRLTFAGPVAEGDTVAPGAALRLCGELALDATPIDAAPRGATRRSYALYRPGFGTPGYSMPLAVVNATYPDRGPSVREPDSYEGLVRLVLAEGTVPIDFARQNGLRLADGVLLLRDRDGIDDPTEARIVAQGLLFQVPPTERVADALERLSHVPAVLAGQMVDLRESPGCSSFSPCPRGHVCCYPCGIPGCARTCVRGDDCGPPRP